MKFHSALFKNPDIINIQYNYGTLWHLCVPIKRNQSGMLMRSVITLHVSIYPPVTQTARDMLYVPVGAGSSPICPGPSACTFNKTLKGCRFGSGADVMAGWWSSSTNSLETSLKRWSIGWRIMNGMPASLITATIFNVFYYSAQNNPWTIFIWTNLILNSSIWSVFELIWGYHD
jgi:hypothetical protein